MKNGKLKLCLTASSGGHLEELSCLESLMKNYPVFTVTEKCDFGEYCFGERQYYVRQINRKESRFFLHFLQILIKSVQIVIKEKPDVIISTGALATFPLCFIGKIIGKKIIYIESFARIDSPSLTGRLIYPFADLFLIQWEELKKVYPRAIYIGSLF